MKFKRIRAMYFWWLSSRASAVLESLLSGHLPSRVFWTMNLYSIGRTLKFVSGASRFRQLKVSSDHGLSFSTIAVPAEEKIPSSVHLTWSQWRNHANFSMSKKVLLIEHPWLQYRTIKGYKPQTLRSGTIIFVSHSVPGKTPPMEDLSKIVDRVEGDPNLTGPFVYCLHMHDYRLGLHREFFKLGRQVITLGNTLSPFFADRFYRTIRNFEFLVSFTPGTQVLLAHEFGIRSVILPLDGEPILGRVKDEFKGEIAHEVAEELVRDFSNFENSTEILKKKNEWLVRGLAYQSPNHSPSSPVLKHSDELKLISENPVPPNFAFSNLRRLS